MFFFPPKLGSIFFFSLALVLFSVLRGLYHIIDDVRSSESPFSFCHFNSVCQDIFKNPTHESQQETVSDDTVRDDLPKKGLIKCWFLHLQD